MSNETFSDDSVTGAETIISYSKVKNTYGFIINICIGLTGLILLLIFPKYVVPEIFFVLIASAFGFKFYKQQHNKEPQIVLSDKGILTSKTPFKAWGEIKNEKILTEVEYNVGNKYTYYYLAYDYPSGSEKFVLSGLDANIKTIAELLIVYRNRFEMKGHSR